MVNTLGFTSPKIHRFFTVLHLRLFYLQKIFVKFLLHYHKKKLRKNFDNAFIEIEISFWKFIF